MGDKKHQFAFLTSIFLFSLMTVLFLMKATFSIDPDIGWELRLGAWMLKHGVPMTDPLSYTMPSYPYANHEWLSGIFLYLLHQIGSMYAIGVFFTGLVLGALALHYRKHHGTLFLFLAVISMILLFDPFGMRAQVISWFFFSLLIKILFSEKLWLRYRFGLPALFLLWANMHGSFALGLLAVILFLGFRLLQKRLQVHELLITGACIAVTFINPFGARLWQEVFLHITNTTLRNSYGEWMPIWHLVNIETVGWGAYMLSACIIVCAFGKKIPRFHLFLLVVLAISGFSSIRQIPYFIITVFPLLLQVLPGFFEKKFLQQYTFRFSALVLLTVWGSSLVFYDGTAAIVEFEPISYPRNAARFLIAHRPTGHILSVYEWGGYLEWKMPSEKEFIDGRMDDTWQWASAPPGESTHIYREDKLLFAGKIPLVSEVKKYGISNLLLPVLIKNDRPLLAQINRGHWKMIYEDTVAVIYEKPDSPIPAANN